MKICSIVIMGTIIDRQVITRYIILYGTSGNRGADLNYPSLIWYFAKKALPGIIKDGYFYENEQ